MFEEPESELDNPEPFVAPYWQQKNEIHQLLDQEVHAHHFRQHLRGINEDLYLALKERLVSE